MSILRVLGIEIRHRKLLAAALAAAIAAVALWPGFHAPAQPMDEGIVLVYPEQLVKGRLPYRDFETIYAPGNLFVLAAAYAACGTNIFVERAVGLSYRLVIVLAVFGIVQRRGTLLAFGCALMMSILLASTDVWANTWTGGVAFALCALWAMAKTDRSWRALAAGMLAAIALLYRYDSAIALTAAVLPLLFYMKASARRKFLLGAAFGLLPLLWLTVRLGITPIVRNLLLLPLFYGGPGGFLPIATAERDVLLLFALYIGAAICNLAAVFVIPGRWATEERRLLLGIALLGLGFSQYALGRFDSGHVLNAALVSVALLPLSIFVLISAVTRKLTAPVTCAIALVFTIGAVALLAPTLLRCFCRNVGVTFALTSAREAATTARIEPGDRGIFIEHHGRSFAFAFSYAAVDADKILSEFERVALPGQRLFVGPADLRRAMYCDAFIYHMLPQLQPATYFLEMNPGSANAPGSRLAADLGTADWLLLNRRWDLLPEPNKSAELGPDTPNEVVRQRFDLWTEVGPYLILRNRRLRNTVVLPP